MPCIRINFENISKHSLIDLILLLYFLRQPLCAPPSEDGLLLGQRALFSLLEGVRQRVAQGLWEEKGEETGKETANAKDYLRWVIMIFE